MNLAAAALGLVAAAFLSRWLTDEPGTNAALEAAGMFALALFLIGALTLVPLWRSASVALQILTVAGIRVGQE